MSKRESWLSFEDDVHTPEAVARRLGQSAADNGLTEPADLPYGATYSSGAALPQNWQSELDALSSAFAAFETGPILADSPSTRLPIIGPFWRRLRRPLHELILFYTNRQIAQQVEINRRIVNLLSMLAEENRRLTETLQRLEENSD